MPIVYQAKFHYTQKKGKEEISLTRTLPDGTHDTSPLNIDEIHQLEDQTRDFKWNKSPDLSRQIGERLFTLLEAAPPIQNWTKRGRVWCSKSKNKENF
jgi:hypothetical protein